jgi:hypothetical protein
MAAKQGKFPWTDKIINANQVGGIETSILDNGLGRGTRIAWINTGTGLRYKVVIDRALDIVDAFYNEHSLVWLSHGGTSVPRPDSDRGIEWIATFCGGLLTTCGLSSMGAPDEEHGLHGRISNIPAEIETIVQPDPANGKLDMSITAVVRETRVFGPNLELRRAISGTLGQPAIRILDIVTNKSNTAKPHMMLYHCNYGWPLIDDGTKIIYKGKCVSRSTVPGDDVIFNSKHDYKTCCKPLESHRGGGEACGIIDIQPDRNGVCTTGLYNQKLGLAVAMKFNKKQLPVLTNWQHFGFGEYVVGLEPGTNPPTGFKKAKEDKKLIMLAAGQSKAYELEISVLTDKKDIDKLLKAGR